MEAEKLLIFLCSGAAKAGDKKLSFRIAKQLETLGIGELGSIQMLSDQHGRESRLQRNMVFINDCRSGCVNILTQGFEKERYLYVDVSPYITDKDFDIGKFIDRDLLPRLAERWTLTTER